MRKIQFAAAFAAAALLTGTSAAVAGTGKETLDAAARSAIKSQFSQLMELANRHDVKAIHEMYWQSPSALLVAKSAVPSEGNWAGYWGNDAIDSKLHDIAASGPVVLTPDMPKLRIAGLTRELAESYVPVTITVSYAGQDGTPKPFLIIIDWLKVGKDWKVASEIILPVPPTPAIKN
jgi:predicted RNA-binding protein